MRRQALLRLIGKWLRAGVSVDGEWSQTTHQLVRQDV